MGISPTCAACSSISSTGTAATTIFRWPGDPPAGWTAGLGTCYRHILARQDELSGGNPHAYCHTVMLSPEPEALAAWREHQAIADVEGEPQAHFVEAAKYVALSDFGCFPVQKYVGRRLSRFGELGHYVVENRLMPVFKSSRVLRQRLKQKD